MILIILIHILGKFYAARYSLDTFNMDGSGYERIMQNTYISGANMKYDAASQRVYWNEEYGAKYVTPVVVNTSLMVVLDRFYSCAVYSDKYANCEGISLFSGLFSFSTPQLTDLVLGNNDMVYMIAMYGGTIYSMDLKIVRNVIFRTANSINDRNL